MQLGALAILLTSRAAPLPRHAACALSSSDPFRPENPPIEPSALPTRPHNSMSERAPEPARYI